MARCFSCGLGLMALVAVGGPVSAQSVKLTDEVRPGDCFQYEIALSVDGNLKVDRDGKPEAIPLKARATHSFVEKVEATDVRGAAGRVVRYYLTAGSESEVGFDRNKRELAAGRRLIVAQRSLEGSLQFSPDGPLTREELELVAEHFDTLCVPALLAGQEVKPGETWPIGPEATQHACLFEGLVKSDLVGKLVEVKGGKAVFTITGTAEGIESGAPATLTITATGQYDLELKRLVELNWEQADVRGQGPASPASEVKAIIRLKRSLLAVSPRELSTEALARLPADGKVPESLTQLNYADPDGRYQFTYSRDWRVVGRTRDHLVMRLLDRGEFAAQATVTNWKKADPGKHAEPDEFKKVLGQLPNWEPEEIVADGPVPTAAGRWLYRVAARGRQDGLAVLQSFYLLAGPGGDQVAVTILTRTEKIDRVGTRDITLVQAIAFPGSK